MIYEIPTNEIPSVIKKQGHLIIISADSTCALVKIDDIGDLNILNSFNDDALDGLISSDKWRQPCTHC